MFSKPIVIAASVASAEAALMAVTTTAFADGTNFSDQTGCGECLGLTGTSWVSGGASSTYAEETTPGTISISGTTLTGDVCCGSDTSQETATTTTFCGARADTTNNTVITLGTNDFFQAAIAQCPHNTTNCTAAGLLKDGTTAITFTDQRYLNLDALGSYVTLSLLHQTATTRGTLGPSQTQRVGDVCTWVVYGKCDAPVITVPSDSEALATTAEYDIQVLEWSNEFLQTTDTVQGATWLAASQSGATSKKWYPPLATDLSAIVTDLKSTTLAPTLTTPNNMLGDVLFKTPVTTGTTYISVPGNTLLDWITNIKAVYTSYDAEVTAYNTEAATWKTYAEYEAPEPGLFDWLFGATEDPDKPATVSSPLQPTQPVDVPATIQSLKLSDSSTTSPAIYGGKAGYGWPSAYMLKPVASNTGKAFGVLGGMSQFDTIATAWATTDAALSIRKTTNKDSTQTDGYLATCDNSFVMITAQNKVAAGTALKTIKLVVTAEDFGSTLEESMPTRPGATTDPVAAPAGAAQLAASAVAAALTALYLF